MTGKVLTPRRDNVTLLLRRPHVWRNTGPKLHSHSSILIRRWIHINDAYERFSLMFLLVCTMIKLHILFVPLASAVLCLKHCWILFVGNTPYPPLMYIMSGFWVSVTKINILYQVFHEIRSKINLSKLETDIWNWNESSHSIYPESIIKIQYDESINTTVYGSLLNNKNI